MPKPKKAEKELESKKNLPDVLELKFEGCEDVVLLMEKLNQLQSQIGRKPDEKKNKPGSGLLAQADEIKRRLSTYMAYEGLTGLRHNSLVFSDTWIDGRRTLDPVKLKVMLAQEGVDLELLNKCIEACTSNGDGYLRRMLIDLDKPREGWED